MEEAGVITFLSGFLTSPWMLVGLAVLAIPPIIHLLNRRRYDVVDWGAMQFLQVSEVTRRRLLLEEILLMLLRMGLLGLLVFALAGPFLNSSLPSRLGSRGSRDVVIVLDASASMAATDETGGKPPFEKAREWVLALLDDLAPGDSVAVLQAKEQVIPVVGELSVDHARVRERLRDMPPPAGSTNWPEAIKRAHAILETSQKSNREIVLLGDNQRFGWADSDSFFRWELLSGELGVTGRLQTGPTERPRLWMVNLAADRSSSPPNWAVTPLRGNRPVVPVDREVTFQSDLMLFGQKAYSPPYRIRLEVDGKHVRDIPPPGGRAGTAIPPTGKVPFSFSHRFGKAGSHLVSVILEADPPPEDRPRGYVVKDHVPGDNRQDFAVEVLTALPVLLIDGEPSAAPPPHLSSDFIRDALSPARDRHPVVKTRVVTASDFTPALLTGDDRPRVVILHNLSRLSAQQNEGISAFLGDGGGVLVALGDRVEAEPYNDLLYRSGEGWLPAQLDGIEGDERRVADAVRPDPASFIHPALELFRKIAVGGLNEARFGRWWKLTTPGKHAPGVPVGLLQGKTAKYPFLVERTYQAGRVLASAVPLDNSWGSNLVDLPAFVPLVHEIVYYLAGARAADYNLRAGQPIRYRLEGDTDAAGFFLQPPAGAEQPLSTNPEESNTYLAQVIRQDRGALLVYDGARETGVYRLTTPSKTLVYYVVPPDARESDLTPCSTEERERVGKMIGVQYEDDRAKIVDVWTGSSQRQDLWLYLLLALIGLLCLEVYMTRRMVMNRV
jgi:hypothetical protein